MDTNINNFLLYHKEEKNILHWIQKNKEIFEKDNYHNIIKEKNIHCENNNGCIKYLKKIIENDQNIEFYIWIYKNKPECKILSIKCQRKGCMYTWMQCISQNDIKIIRNHFWFLYYIGYTFHNGIWFNNRINLLYLLLKKITNKYNIHIVLMFLFHFFLIWNKSKLINYSIWY